MTNWQFSHFCWFSYDLKTMII